ncbi:MAG: Holliday junction resolvase RuvX, partial [Acidobacteriales bacterium]|nr:Holliday junction resolvase RuvX [Terriglobales bacterium]
MQSAKQGRTLAIDLGSRRIGLAVSDALGITAQGLPTLERRNKREDLFRLGKLIHHYQIAEIVLGNPLRMSGEGGTASQRSHDFAELLRQKFELPVHLLDERLTTAEAHRVLDEAAVPGRRRKEMVDELAAVLILQQWLAL